MSDQRFELVCDEGAERLDTFLAARLTQLSRSRLQSLIREGRVSVDGRAATKTSQGLLPGAWVEVELPPPEPSYLKAEPISLDVRFEDAHLLVVNKPAGMVVHPGAGQRRGTLAGALLHRCRGQLSGIGGVERPGIVHRLDKDTSGLLLVAKTDTAHRKLSADLKARRIHRTYLTIVCGKPIRERGIIEAPIGRHPTHRTAMAVISGGKRAVTHYAVREVFNGAALLEVELETGRTHQIRVHLAYVGYPVLGDLVYGRGRLPARPSKTPRVALIARQALHAFRLRFTHPITDAEICIEAEPPKDFLAALDALREGAAAG